MELQLTRSCTDLVDYVTVTSTYRWTDNLQTLFIVCARFAWAPHVGRFATVELLELSAYMYFGAIDKWM